MNRVFAFLLCVGNAFSMDWKDPNKAHRLMDNLICDTIYSRELPSQDEIRSVIYQCLDLLGGNGYAVHSRFYDLIPERAKSFSATAQLLDELGDAFHNEFYEITKDK